MVHQKISLILKFYFKENIKLKKNKKIISVFFGLVFFILSFAIVIQTRSLKSNNSPFLKIEADNELRNELLK